MTGRTSAPQRSYGGRTATERRNERRERLMSAGLDLFGTEGYAATSIERLCNTAGVSTRNFYQEFEGREALVTALHDRVTQWALDAVVTALVEAEGAELRSRIELAVQAYLGTTASDPRWARVAYVEVIGVSPAVEQHRLDWRRRWAELLEVEAHRAVERGEAPDRDFHLATVAVIGIANELVHHWSTQGCDTPLAGLNAELTRLITAALTAP